MATTYVSNKYVKMAVASTLGDPMGDHGRADYIQEYFVNYEYSRVATNR